MFNHGYFPGRYFAPRYFPPAALVPPPPPQPHPGWWQYDAPFGLPWTL